MNSINFRARKIAETKNIYKKVATDIDLYELTKRDNLFLVKLAGSTNFSKLVPDMCEYYQYRWQRVFNYAIESAINPNYRAFIALHNNKPCGIMTCKQDGNNLYLDSICDIPVKGGKRVNYTGSTLFCLLYKIAEELNVKGISLAAVPDGPIDVVSKYLDKGFKIINQNELYTDMFCSKYKIREKLKELLSNISYKTIKKSKDVSLDEFI